MYPDFQSLDPDFIWGVSTSAPQTEGSALHDGKSQSIWDAFTVKKGNVQGNHTLENACEFYERADTDLSLLDLLQIPNFRFSISWPRVLPDGIGQVNNKGLDFYDRIVDQCLSKNIEPWITLYHWDLPQVLEQKGGWKNRDILSWFAEYLECVTDRLGDRVSKWMVLNEPMVFTGAGYFLGVHAPGKTGLSNFLPAVHHAALCQAQGISQLQKKLPTAEIGTTFSCSWLTPHRAASVKDQAAVKRVDALLNRLFADPLHGKGYPITELNWLKRIEQYFQPEDEKRLIAQPDFIGIQNYTREVVKHSWLTPYMHAKLVPPAKRNTPSTVMKWEVNPNSLYNILHQFSQYPGCRKIYVTENGAAFPDVLTKDGIQDKQRIDFLKSYIEAMCKAKNEGVPVKGYFVWSLTDNFEWSEGYHPRFGLIHVDYQTQNRTIKDSGFWYSRMISHFRAAKSLSPDQCSQQKSCI